MGTRADFYAGRGGDAEWLGSIAWDGYPEGVGSAVTDTTNPARYAEAVGELLRREDGTTPDLGWPWPWDDSGTTDYAYAFDGGKVWVSCFGSEWVEAVLATEDFDWESVEDDAAVFPAMSTERSATPGSKRSGLMVISVPGDSGGAA